MLLVALAGVLLHIYHCITFTDYTPSLYSREEVTSGNASRYVLTRRVICKVCIFRASFSGWDKGQLLLREYSPFEVKLLIF